MTPNRAALNTQTWNWGHLKKSRFSTGPPNKDILMVLKGELAKMMIQIAPQVYQKYVTMDKKGTKILYVKLQKVLYGLMRASLLFYRKLREELEAYSFIVNPYDPCIANLTSMDGKQLTMIWHMNDLMASCKDDFELTKKFSGYLARISEPKLTMHTGWKHNYLGMDLEFNKDGTLDMSMVQYLKNIIAEFPEVIQGKAATPAVNYLFQIRDEKEAQPLPKEQALAFHHTVVQLLFMGMRARQDVQMTMVFLTTRVKSPDKDNWGKLKRVLKYLNRTKNLKLKLKADNVGILKWYVDGSHNVH